MNRNSGKNRRGRVTHHSPAATHTMALNPILPFTGSIHGGLQDGKLITVSGRVKPGADRFHINLQCGSGHNAEVAFHFNPRYDPLAVICNSFQSGRWGAEERHYNAPLPQGGGFSITFTVRTHAFQVSINNLHFLEFSHKVPFHRVDTIQVDGRVEVSSITFTNPTTGFPVQPGFPAQTGFPAQPGFVVPSMAVPSYGAFPPPPAYPGFPSQPAMPVVPYCSAISGGLMPGRTITIQGAVALNAIRFVVNLSSPLGIALHYNPRFNEKVVVRNTKEREKWGSEERGGAMPFQKGQAFTLIICCEQNSFRIIVNGMQAHDYRHRFYHLHQINMLEIDGDVTLTSVMV